LYDIVKKVYQITKGHVSEFEKRLILAINRYSKKK
jgi:hypothetical protein